MKSPTFCESVSIENEAPPRQVSFQKGLDMFTRIRIAAALLLCFAGTLRAQDFAQPLEILNLQQAVKGHLENGRWSEATAALERILEISSDSPWPLNLLAEPTHDQLADLYIVVGDYPMAVHHAREHLEILERRSAPDDELATSLLDLGQIERIAEEGDAAADHLDRALRLRSRLFGLEAPETAEVHEALGVLYMTKESRAKAHEHLERAREIKEQQLPPDSPELASVYVNLAMLYRPQGRVEESRELLERALAIEERHPALGPVGHAVTLGHLGMVLWELGRWGEAKVYIDRAIKLTESALGEDHPQLITDLTNLGHVHYELGEIEEALKKLRRACDIARRKLGGNHRLTLEAHHSLGAILMMAGKWEEARTVTMQNLRLRKSLLGPDHVDTAMSRAVLGQLLSELGGTEEGVTLMTRAISALSKADRLEDSVSSQVVLYTVDTMIQLHLSQRERVGKEDFREMAAILEQVRERLEAIHGHESLRLAEVYGVSAKLALARGDLLRAREDHAHVRKIHEAIGLGDHPAKAVYYGNEASLRRALRDLPGAVAAMEHALDLFTRIYGRNSARSAQARVDLASILEAMGKIDRALDLLAEALAVEEEALRQVVAGGSEMDQRRFLRTLDDSSLLATTLHYRSAPRNPRALRLALETVLRRKSRDFDAAVLRSRLANGGDERVEAMRQELRRLRSQWGRGLMSGEPDSESSWSNVVEIERRLADAAGVEPLRSISLREVQRSLSPKSALVEIVALEPPNVVENRNEPKRYLAYVLRPEGDPRWVDLGLAQPIDDAIEAFLQAIDRRDPDVRCVARELEALTFARIRPLLGKVDTVVISPDGELHRVPFAALADDDGRFLLERWSISYLTSGRDLVELSENRTRARERPWILADPDFGTSAGDGKSIVDPRALQALPGAREEARRVGELLGLPPERVHLGPNATERVMRAVQGPLVLHLATHGFLLPDPENKTADRLQRGLVRSGLALAGIGHYGVRDPADDGFLSAIELAELDLGGTEIGVLSACDTGRGELEDGSGLFGLRRALAVAGARTQVTSLWRVPDHATADLMYSWYAQLTKGVSRGEAWRRVQLAALAGDDLPELDHPARGAVPLDSREEGSSTVAQGTRHPYYWAAFVVSGDTGPVPELQALGAGGRDKRVAIASPPEEPCSGGQ